MSAEAALWVLMRRSRLPGHWVRVENMVGEGGTPDLNFCLPEGLEGWMELKSIQRWSHVASLQKSFTRGQRLWHLARERAGGRTYVLLRIMQFREEPQCFILMRGTWAAENLGKSSVDGYMMFGAWNRDEFLTAIRDLA